MRTILYIRSTFHSGGTENLIVRIFNQPSDTFNIVLVLMKPGSMMYDLKEGKNKVIHLYRKGKQDIGFILKLFSIIRKEKVYAIHTHQEIELLYALIIKFFRPATQLFHHVHLRNPASSVWFFFERAVCNVFVRKVITVSNTMNDYLVENGFTQGKIILIYNIVAVTNKLSLKDKEVFKGMINYLETDFLIGMIGNFVREKDQFTLALAFKNLLASHKNIKLVFIGKEGEWAKASRELFTKNELENSVFFTGQLNNASELIPLFNLMVFSSKSETFGMAALETLLYKVPVIASAIPAIIELSDNGKYFPLFPVGDHERLAKMIEHYVTEGNNDNKLQIAKEYAEKEFSAEGYVKKLSDIYFN